MDIIEIAIERAVKFLDAAGVQYAIKMPDGTMKGELKFEPPKKMRVHKGDLPWGDLSKQLDVYIKPLKVGEVVRIENMIDEKKGFTIRRIQGVASSRAILHFGKGNTITHRNGDVLEVLRVS